MSEGVYLNSDSTLLTFVLNQSTASQLLPDGLLPQRCQAPMCNCEKKSLLSSAPEYEAVQITVSSETSRCPPSPKTAESGSGVMQTPWRLKLAILCAVTLQNAGYALVRRYSRGFLREAYSASSALFVMEMVKLVISAVQVVVSDAPSDVPDGSPLVKYLHLIRHSAKMAVPAVIYLVMNILGFLSLAHIDASTFAIVSQMNCPDAASLRSGDASVCGRQDRRRRRPGRRHRRQARRRRTLQQ